MYERSIKASIPGMQKHIEVLKQIEAPYYTADGILLEEKLKAALASNDGEPATVIARMILEREMQKVETRKKYSS